MTASKTVTAVEKTQTEKIDSDFAEFGMSGHNPFASVSVVEFVKEIKSTRNIDTFKFVIYCNKNQLFSAQVINAIIVYIESGEKKEIRLSHKGFSDMYDNVTQIKVSETASRKIPSSKYMKIIGVSLISKGKDKKSGNMFEFVSPLEYKPVDETNAEIMKTINANVTKFKLDIIKQAEMKEINMDGY